MTSMRTRGRFWVCTAVAALVGWAGPARGQAPPAPVPQESQVESALPPGLVPSSLEEAPNERVWTRTEYLLWWVHGQQLPPLVTTGPADQAIFPGILGQPATSIVLGNNTTSPGAFSGGPVHNRSLVRPLSTIWTGSGLPVSGATLAIADGRLTGHPAAVDPLFRRFPRPRSNDGTRVNHLPVLRHGRSFHLDPASGAEANGILSLIDRGNFRLQGLAGFRWINLDESLAFSTSSPNISFVPQSIFLTQDHFLTRNDFYGGQVGLRAEVERGCFFLAGSGKVALGTMVQSTRINGALVTNEFQPGIVESFPAAYLAAPTNAGDHQRSRFAVAPEASLSVGVKVTDGIRLSAGYSFLYLSSVARPADQIDHQLNPTQMPAVSGEISPLVGAARPAFQGNHSGFWAQGINLDLELRY